ncbi:hypothetical protein S7335_3111 [Synechococcus sp. PCC 7335]|uniref:SBBP repeat-containing protein n=1 Tax=Synechococcus sp. (strain ATCC 29403 / PCC 7335) TaxID=91464 RepID=UPI00017ECAAB|nr:SBBP repeat-containing protein [Synechococcus sp. PCC 7335]EDX85410.1 hypothetical protein S7335_3111 [Synechococcus sp. PCC 7335]
MDEINISFGTPGSDYLSKIFAHIPASNLLPGGEEFQIVLGRAGNDTLNVYDPTSEAPDTPNVDLLIGDLFDNTPEEFNVFSQILAGNLFAILAADIPSVGADRFVLGNESHAYYTNPSAQALTTTDPGGFNQFAIIYDFDPEQDVIQLHGSQSNYVLQELEDFPIEGLGLFSGEAIYSTETGAADLVGLVVSTPEVDLALDGDYLQYVDKAVEGKPKRNKGRRGRKFGTLAQDQGYGIAVDPRWGQVYVTGITTGSLNGPNQGATDVWLSKISRKGRPRRRKSFQLGTSGVDSAYNVVTDADGNFYVAGDTEGSLFGSDDSPNGSDAWVAKYARNGKFLWGQQIGESVTGGFSSTSTGLQVDDDGNVYLSGLAIKASPNPAFPIQDDAWVVKLDSYGEQQWFTQISDPLQPDDSPLANTPFFDETYDLAVDTTGNSYLVGWTQGLTEPADPSRSILQYDAWLSKVASDGTIEWTQQFGSTDEAQEFAWGVDTDSEGNIYVTGWTTGTLGDQSFGSYDVWLAKFTPDGGDPVWKKQIGSTGDDGQLFADILIDSSDNLFVSGYTNGDLDTDELTNGGSGNDYDAWVGRFDLDGTTQWIQEFGLEGKDDYATRLAIDDRRGWLYATGFTEGPLGNVDPWVTKLDAYSGQLQNFPLSPLDGAV